MTTKHVKLVPSYSQLGLCFGLVLGCDYAEVKKTLHPLPKKLVKLGPSQPQHGLASPSPWAELYIRKSD